MPVQWEVFFVPQCRHAKPDPKDKLIVIAYTEPFYHGFLINSRINDYIQARPHLLYCEALISVNEHSFLRYDSYVDCQNIYPFDEKELTNSRGILSLDAQKIVIESVRNCPTLPRRHKKIILTQS